VLRQFVVVWMLYWITVAALPVHSIYPATSQALLLQVSFVLIVWFCAKAVLDAFHVRGMPTASHRNIRYSSAIIWIAIALSVIGLASLAFDKVYIQKIDYSAGVAFARQEWRQLGEDREGHASSVFSAAGYLLGSSYFVAAILAVTQGAVISARTRVIALVASFLLLMANSLLTGGRSSVLLIAAFLAGAFSSRRGISVRGLFASAWQRRFIQLLVFLAVGYSVFIFYQRADASDVSGLVYATDFLPYLGIEADAWYRHSLGESALSSIVAMLVLAGSYVTHSFASVAAIIDAPAEDKSIIFANVAQMLYKLGIVARPDESWFLEGRFSSVPGALWHQFGAFGFFAGSVVLGSVAGAAKVWVARRPDHMLSLGAYTMATATLLLTPALFAPDFMSFPFVAGSFVILAIARKMLGDLRSRRRVHFSTRQAA
jgi:oligosaccharide repeat unit polymerase